jgi:SAM-dependent methyltransferase
MAVTMAVFFLYFRREGLGRAFWLGILLYQVLTLSLHVKTMVDESLAFRRNFYATLRVVPLATPKGEKYLSLSHGVVAHGRQFIDPAKQGQGTSYYSPLSGGALAMRLGDRPKKVGLVGLGTGTLALYGRPGGSIRSYEINPQVVELAQRYFSFLSLGRSSVTHVLGDARLSLEAEPPNGFDVLAVDAFSGDAIPAHLLTREAFQVYRKHLKPDGILAFHTSNRHLKLGWAVLALAREEGYGTLVARNPKDEEELVDFTEWVLVSRNEAALKAIRNWVPGPQPAAPEGLRAWTDDHHSLFPLLR